MRAIVTVLLVLMAGCGLGIEYASEPACYYLPYGVDGGCNMPVNYPHEITPQGESK